jgi:hypothetical protein
MRLLASGWPTLRPLSDAIMLQCQQCVCLIPKAVAELRFELEMWTIEPDKW